MSEPASSAAAVQAQAQKQKAAPRQNNDVQLKLANFAAPVSAACAPDDCCAACGQSLERQQMAKVVDHLREELGDGIPSREDVKKVMDDYKPSEAHSILPQSKIRKIIRQSLDEVLRAKQYASPCVFASPTVREDLTARVKQKLLAEAAADVPDAAAAGRTVDKKASEWLKRPAQLQATAVTWVEGWSSDPPAPTKARPGKPEQEARERVKPNDKQKRKIDWIKTVLPDDADITSEPGENGTWTLKATSRQGADRTVAYTYTLDSEGVCGAAKKTVIAAGQAQEEEDLRTPTNRITSESYKWLGEFAKGITSPPYTEGMQCRYCETIQGDENLPQRLAIKQANPDLPVEYVGRKAAERVRTRIYSDAGEPLKPPQQVHCATADMYIRNYVDDVTHDVVARLKEECRKLLKAAAPVDLADADKPAAKNWADPEIPLADITAEEWPAILEEQRAKLPQLIGGKPTAFPSAWVSTAKADQKKVLKKMTAEQERELSAMYDEKLTAEGYKKKPAPEGKPSAWSKG